MIKALVGLTAAFSIATGTNVHLDKAYESRSMEMSIPEIPEYRPLKVPNSYLSVHDRYEERKVTPKKKKFKTRKVA